jgi:hypothetical protein
MRKLITKKIKKHFNINSPFYCSYSQFGEDAIARSYFYHKNSLHSGGFYVDIGAYDPFKFSNTFIFHEFGWKGINVDLSEISIDQFKNHRPFDINLNIGISEFEGEIEFYSWQKSLFNTMSFEQAKKHEIDFQLGHPEIKKVKSIPLKTLFNDYLPSGTKVNLLNIDAESYDLMILKSNDWSLYRPEVIIIEDHEYRFNTLQKSEINLFLENKGYLIFGFSGPSFIYVLQ